MAISYVGETHDTSANTGNGSWSLPADWRVGELAVFYWYSRLDSTFAPPAGVTTVLSSDLTGTGYGNMYIGVRYLVAGDTTFSWTATTGTNMTSGWICAVFGGTQYGVNRVENTAAAVSTESGSANITPPAVTIGHTGDLSLIFYGAVDNRDTGYAMPTGYTTVNWWSSTLGNDASGAMGYKMWATAGTETPGAIVKASYTYYAQAYTISLCYQNPYGVVPSASTVRSHLYASKGVIIIG